MTICGAAELCGLTSAKLRNNVHGPGSAVAVDVNIVALHTSSPHTLFEVVPAHRLLIIRLTKISASIAWRAFEMPVAHRCTSFLVKAVCYGLRFHPPVKGRPFRSVRRESLKWYPSCTLVVTKAFMVQMVTSRFLLSILTVFHVQTSTLLISIHTYLEFLFLLFDHWFRHHESFLTPYKCILCHFLTISHLATSSSVFTQEEHIFERQSTPKLPIYDPLQVKVVTWTRGHHTWLSRFCEASFISLPSTLASIICLLSCHLHDKPQLVASTHMSTHLSTQQLRLLLDQTKFGDKHS